jgi:Ca2+-binding RTX toxin-like protein
MANNITANNSSQTLINALLASASGITITSSSLTSAPGSANLYDGGLQGIGAGILLTSGTTPGTVNDSTGFGIDNGLAGSAALDAVVNTVFQTQSFNATSLTFSFTVADLTATSVSFDLVFGSEEYPEWVDSFVDVAVVMVNGSNVALFNHDPNHPLSVISPNLAAGYFVDNANGALPTQYDGVSSLLKFVAPIHAGVNTITIAIADTGDGILDSGVFVSNLSAGTTPGSGVVSAPNTGTSGNDTLTGTVKAEYFDLQAGNDTVYAGAGDDIVVAGAGNDAVYGGSGADAIEGDAGDDLIDGGADSDTAVYAGGKADYDISFDGITGNYTVTAKAAGASAIDGQDTLVGVEFAKFGDGTTWSLDTTGVVSQTGTAVVVPVGNLPGSVFLSGVGAQGQTLTAKVSDADGVLATGISYAWQATDKNLVVTDLGITGSTFVVGAAQVGQDITVTAQYTDLAGHAESLTSAAKAIAAPGNGDFAITLLQLKAPIGASVSNPLTTLVQNAIELGVSPNEAGIIIKSALGIAPTVNLQHYDSWAALQADPVDAAALAVEKKLVQVAVMTSLGSDETGMALTQAILLADSNNATLNLTNKAVIANLLGLDPTNALVHEIWDRNDTIGAAADTAEIDSIWLDMQSGLSVNLSDSIGTLSVHINQAPIGSANATLASGNEGIAYVVSASDLLAGFTDPEGSVLHVANLAADHGSVMAGAGNFTITPTAGYSGPIELTYSVADDLGLTAPATQLFVVTPNAVTPPPVNQAPAGSATAVLVAGSEDTAYTVAAADLLAGFTDANGDTLSVANLGADHGAVTDNGDGTFTITPDADYFGPVNLSYNVTDGNGGSTAATQSFNVSAVNDAPALTGTAATLATGTEDTAYAIAAADLLAGFTDIDGDTLSVNNLTASNGTLTANGTDWTFTPNANYNGAVALSYNVTDGNGGSTAATQSFSLAAVNDAPTGSATAALVTGTEDTPYTIAEADLLSGFSDVEGDALSVTNLTANHGALTNNGNGTWTFTPAANYAGAVTLGYEVSDGTSSVTATQSFNLTAVNDAPLAVADSASTTALTPVLINVLANDSDVDSASLSIKAGNLVFDPLHGTAQIVGNQIEFTSANGFTGVATLSYVATDGLANSAAANVSITVNPAATPPIPGVILGTAGNDNLVGTNGNDWLDGGAGADTLAGGLGDDTYVVDNKSDKVIDFSGQGIDTVRSGVDFELGKNTENLILTGLGDLNGKGNDLANVLIGNAGKNEFDGGKGNDILIGGGGKDKLVGGAGADIFKFLNITDSVVGSKRDTIEDFKVGVDRIDLSAIDAVTGTAANEAFVLISTNFTHETGQLRFDTAKGILAGDVNGDGLADFEIALAGVSQLSLNDLML